MNDLLGKNLLLRFVLKDKSLRLFMRHMKLLHLQNMKTYSKCSCATIFSVLVLPLDNCGITLKDKVQKSENRGARDSSQYLPTIFIVLLCLIFRLGTIKT